MKARGLVRGSEYQSATLWRGISPLDHRASRIGVGTVFSTYDLRKELKDSIQGIRMGAEKLPSTLILSCRKAHAEPKNVTGVRRKSQNPRCASAFALAGRRTHWRFFRWVPRSSERGSMPFTPGWRGFSDGAKVASAFSKPGCSLHRL